MRVVRSTAGRNARWERTARQRSVVVLVSDELVLSVDLGNPTGEEMIGDVVVALQLHAHLAVRLVPGELLRRPRELELMTPVFSPAQQRNEVVGKIAALRVEHV